MSTDQQTIMIVDDEPMNISILMSLLKDDYRLLAAKNGTQALQRIESGIRPDLILLDVMMPELSGFEVCKRLRNIDGAKNIPVIFVTAMNDELDETRGLELGAVDYLRKPISAPIVEARIKNHLALKKAREDLQQHNEILEQRVRERTRDLQMTRDVTIFCMANLAETRDNETGMHIRRTQHYVKELALALKDHPDFADSLNEHTIDLLFKSAPLHDIGKVGIPDHILLKPGKLTDDEFNIMKMHVAYGRNAILEAVTSVSQGDNSCITEFLNTAIEISYGHHEKWNGTGYPQGLAGDDIPLSARLMALGDVYDALISKRVYKPAFSHEKSVSIILEDSGTHFDPRIVEAFDLIKDRFLSISREYADSTTEPETELMQQAV